VYLQNSRNEQKINKNLNSRPKDEQSFKCWEKPEMDEELNQELFQFAVLIFEENNQESVLEKSLF